MTRKLLALGLSLEGVLGPIDPPPSPKGLRPRLTNWEICEMVRVIFVAGFLLALVASRGLAQEHQHGNGEKLGTVHFATSCNEAAQKEFNRAVALLHSFQFSRAIEGFNAVLGRTRRAESPTGESRLAIGVILSRRE